MTGFTFRHFKNAIETVDVVKQTRSTLGTTVDFDVALDCIVKRRYGMSEAVNDSEDNQSETTIHFKPEDAQYIEVGNYVRLDGGLRTIRFVKHGKDFHTGKLEFLWATIGNDILEEGGNGGWGGSQ